MYMLLPYIFIFGIDGYGEYLESLLLRSRIFLNFIT